MERNIEQTDLDGATRGLQMSRKTVAELQDTIAKHEGIDLFASRVIVKAAHIELIQRGVQHAD